MSTRYGNRDYERGERDYGRRSDSDYDRSSSERYQGRYGSGRDENEREYGGESRWRGQSGGGSQYGGGQYGGGGSRSRSRGEYRSGREGYRPGSENDLDYSDDRESRYGSIVRGYDTGDYDDTSSGRSQQRYNYPTGFRSGESYGERGRGYDDEYERGRYGSGQQRGWSSRGQERGWSGQERGRWGEERGRYGEESGDYGQERGWWDRASDAVASWFGDEDAERRRRMDEQRRYPGKGPKGYRRSDERIKEDINDRLSEGYLDATDIEVMVADGEVTLTGTVNSRSDKRRAEDIAEYVSGVKNVENRLRVKQSDIDRYPSMTGTSTTAGATGTTGTTGTSGTTGTTDTSSSSAAARGRTAGT